jgi:hypothetical protein
VESLRERPEGSVEDGMGYLLGWPPGGRLSLLLCSRECFLLLSWCSLESSLRVLSIVVRGVVHSVVWSYL